MTTTARISSQTAAATYNFTVATGVTAQFGASGLSGEEVITIKKQKSDSTYDALYYRDAGGVSRAAEMTALDNTVSVTGPFEGQISKPVTASATEVVEYT